jgi:hypothetical protein
LGFEGWGRRRERRDFFCSHQVFIVFLIAPHFLVYKTIEGSQKEMMPTYSLF